MAGSPHPGPRRVARLEELPDGRGLRVRIAGIEVGLFRVGDVVHAMEDRCPHAGVSLSDGVLDGPIVTCKAHGQAFDVRTGFRPDHEDGFPIPCFPVQVEDGWVWVDVGRPVNLRRRR